MPLYEYSCNTCRIKTELIERADAPPCISCPQCGSKDFKRVFSASVGMHFKGSGFYSTDYATKHESNSSSQKDDKKGSSCGSSCSCH